MKRTDEEHQRWFMVCPELRFSYCVNLVITVLWILFMPAILLIMSLLGLLVFSLFVVPCESGLAY